jgi:phosphoribosyl 1,2-cyclic phosphodiesterase
MMRFSVLASGSGGNASLLEFNGFGLLIDAGLGPRLLASRLAAIGASWRSVSAVLLSHTHGDHWKDHTLGALLRGRIPVYCHREHFRELQALGMNFANLLNADLVRTYERDQDLTLTPHLTCRPLEVLHDSEPTFGFRFDATEGLFGAGWSLAHLSDLGCWSAELAEAAASVDVLALEFNHDIDMERGSNRPAVLIERVLSDMGHLSNTQAADLLRAILNASGPNTPHHLVQLHLSRECNQPYLAQAAARQVGLDAPRPLAIHTACQHQAGPTITLNLATAASRRAARPAFRLSRPAATQPSLPGME